MFSRAIPQIVDRHTQTAIRGMRRSQRRTILCYLPITITDAAGTAGYDDVSDSPFVMDQFQNERSITYRVIEITGGVRWEGANEQDSNIGAGYVKEGAISVYVSLQDSGWIAATANDQNAYCVIDGARCKVVGGPMSEGVGAVLEHSYRLVQWSRDGSYDGSDGGTRGVTQGI